MTDKVERRSIQRITRESKQDMEEIKEAMKRLKNMEAQLVETAAGEHGGMGEAIWKTPAAKRLMGKQLEEATKKMADDISTMEETLKMTGELLRQEIQESKIEDETDKSS